MKKKYLYLIVVVVLLVLAATVIALTSRSKKTGNINLNLNIPGVSETRAQSYSVTKYPELQADDKTFGSKEALLKIFVYEDYTLGLSAKLADTLDRIKAEVGDQVVIIIRPYFKNSSLASEAQSAVDCAGEQNKWVEMRALLFTQTKNKQLSGEKFSAYAEQIGLNINDFTSCLTNSQKSVKIEQLIQEAETYTVQGAPTMFVGSEMILGARPYEDFTDSNGDRIEGLKTVVKRILK